MEFITGEKFKELSDFTYNIRLPGHDEYYNWRNTYNKVEIEKYKEQLQHHKKYEEIMSAIDNMMLNKPVIYEAINLSTRKLAWYNNLYMDQKSSNIMPPIVVPNSDFKLDFEVSSY